MNTIRFALNSQMEGAVKETTETKGLTAPEGSVTVPRMVPVVWAQPAPAPTSTARTPNQAPAFNLSVIMTPAVSASNLPWSSLLLSRRVQAFHLQQII